MLLLVATAWAHNPHSMIVGACFPADADQPWYALYDGAESNVLYRSEDRGRTWLPVHAAATRDRLTALACTRSTLAAIGEDGVWTSTDGATWSADPIEGATKLAADDDNLLVLAADGLRWGLPGAWAGPVAGPWVALGGGPGGLVAVDELGGIWTPSGAVDGAPASPRSVATDGTRVWVGLDSGKVWSDGVSVALPNDSSVVALTTTTDGRLLAATADRGPYESVDGGATWSDPGSPFVTLYGQSGAAESEDEAVTAMAGNADTTALAGWYGIAVQAEDGWRHETVLASDSLRDVAFSPDFEHDGLIVVAGLGGGVVRTRDGGASWDAPAWGMPLPNVQRVAVDPDDTTRIFAVVDHELYESTDAGATWGHLDVPFAKLSEVVVADGLWIVGDEPAGGFSGNIARATGAGWVDVLPDMPVGKLFVDAGRVCVSGAKALLCWDGDWVQRYDHGATAIAGDTWADDSGVWMGDTLVLDGADDPIGNLVQADDGTLFASSRGGELYRSDDGGGDWVPLDLDLPAAPVTMDARPGFSEHPELLLASYDGLWLVDEAGARRWGQFQSTWANSGFVECAGCEERAADCATGREITTIGSARLDWRGTALYADGVQVASADEDGVHELVLATPMEVSAFTTAGPYAALEYTGGAEAADAECVQATEDCGCATGRTDAGLALLVGLLGLRRRR